MFTLLTRVRPIKVGFPNRFLRVAGNGLLVVLIHRKIEEDNSYGAFLPLKIAFFWVFENDKNFRSNKSYMVTKRQISPHRKLRSL